MIKTLGSLLGDSLSRAKILPEIEATFVMKHFRDLVKETWGKAVEAKMVPQYLKNRCLSVAVGGNVYAQEIKLKEKELIAQINKRMRRNLVDRIYCLV